MRYSNFSKRAKAYLMDYLIVSIPIMRVISFMAFSFFKRYRYSKCISIYIINVNVLSLFYVGLFSIVPRNK